MYILCNLINEVIKEEAIMKTMQNINGNEGNRRIFNAVTHDEKEEESTWRGRSTNNKWDEDLSRENSFGTGREFGMAIDNKRRHESESKTVHIEDWENDPYISGKNNEEDVRGEFAVREKQGAGSNGRGNEYVDEDQQWNMHGPGTGSGNNRRGNEYRKSGTDETIGVP
jgi:hypothetical protein